MRSHALAVIATLAWFGSAGAMLRANECRDLVLRQHEALWAVAMAVPDGPGRDFRLLDLRIYPLADHEGPADLIICGRLAFGEQDAGVARFAMPYGRDARGDLRPGLPFFYGDTWLRGTLALADLCAAAEARSPARPGTAAEDMAWRR